jgi:hypothetical protein
MARMVIAVAAFLGISPCVVRADGETKVDLSVLYVGNLSTPRG